MLHSLPVLGLWSCEPQSEAKTPASALSRVSFAVGGCYDSCNFQAIRVDSHLTYQYYGQDTLEWYGRTRAPLQGYYTGRVTQAFWDTLVAKIERARLAEDAPLYPDWRESYDGGLDVEWVLSAPKGQVRLRGQRGRASAAVSELEAWLSASYQQAKLHPSPDSLLFETSCQYWSEPPPFPKLN